MSNQISIQKYIEDAFQANQFAVLATVGDDQPHASLIALTPFAGLRQLIFATYRNTQKYSNLAHNNKVAVLIEGKNEDKSGIQNGFVITAYGVAEEISITTNDMALKALLCKHPDLLSFTAKDDCALIMVKVEKFQVVQGIDNVVWCSVDDLDKL